MRFVHHNLPSGPFENVEMSFAVRVRLETTLPALAASLGTALRCSFQPVVVSDVTEYVTEQLGLRLALTDWDAPNSEPGRIFQLRGSPLDVVEIEGPLIDCSAYVRRLLRLRTGIDWYVPTKEELLREAGLKP